MVNELRGGYSLVHRNVSFGITAAQAASTLGLTNLPGIPPGDDIPTLAITGFMGIVEQANDTNPHEGTYQLTDTFTWTKQKHTLEVWRRLSATSAASSPKYSTTTGWATISSTAR